MSPQPRISKLAADATRRIIEDAVLATGAVPLVDVVVAEGEQAADNIEVTPPLTEAERLARLKPGPDEAGLTYEQIIEERQKKVDAAREELWPSSTSASTASRATGRASR
jgi:hypothetical protein